MTPRREFFKQSVLGLVGGVSCQMLFQNILFQDGKTYGNGTEWILPTERMRAITRGPLFHWGAYYDQVHFDKTNRIVIGNQVNFEGRSPTPEDRITVGLIDTEENDRWTPIGSSTSWNWQQGCMLQWIPGDGNEVIWNERDGDRFVSRTYDYQTGGRRTFPGPVYGVSPNGKFAVRPDFRRLGDTRPGYGYVGIPDPNANVFIPDNSGVWRLDFETGVEKLLFTISDVAQIPTPGGFPPKVKHWFNHLIVSPDSSRFLFLHRWQRTESSSQWYTRLCTANVDGTGLYVLNEPPMTSHLVWRDAKHVIAFASRPSHGNKLYLFEDQTNNVECCAPDLFTGDTHVSYVQGTQSQWILNDTYPRGANRIQELFLVKLSTEKRVDLANIPIPPDYQGEWRVDLHPRCSRDGKKVLIDAPAPVSGGRQIYLIDIAGLCD